MDPQVIYNTQPGLTWDWRVAVDLYFGGMGVGAFLFAVLVDWRYKGRFQRICQTGACLAPLLVVIGLVFLMLKMGRPFNMFQTFINFAPTSPLWWGGIFQTLFIFGGVVYGYLWLRPEVRARERIALGWALLPISLIVGAYHGLLLSVIRSRPLWNTGPTVVAAILAFVSTGIAAIMLVHLVRMHLAGRLKDERYVRDVLSDLREVRQILGAALLAQGFTLFIWWLSLKFGHLDAQEALQAANTAYGPWFWLVGIGLGVVVPLLLGAYTMLRQERISTRFEVNMIWITSGLILVGGFVFRWAVVLGGQVALPIHTLS